MSNRRNKSIIIFIISLLFFYSCTYPLFQIRERLHLLSPEEETNLKKLPPEIVFTTVLLGGFRGILVDLLWLRAMRLQEDGKYFELVQLSDWIGLLEPYLPSVWKFNAWNLSYNVSVEFPTGEERWNWIYQGIKLLRDKALKYLPDSGQIYKELSWIHFHKISDTMDEFNAYYKRSWAKMMQNVFGNMTLEEIASNSSYETLLEDKNVEVIISSFKEKEIDILNDWKQISDGDFVANLPEDLRELTWNPSFRKIEAYLRSKTLREEFKLDPEYMLELEKKYFPFDWKSPAAHSLYWIEEGIKKTDDMREIDYRRMVYFSLNHLLKWGRVDLKKIGDEEVLILAPEFDVVPILNSYYEETIQNLEKAEEVTTGTKSSHLYFLSEVVILAYTMNNLPVARKYYLYLKDKYPMEVKNLSFPDYIASKFVTTLDDASIPEITSVLFGLMYQGYWALAVGEDERALGLHSLAKAVYDRTAKNLSRFQKLFPTFDALKKSSLEASLTMLPLPIASSLRSRLGIEEPAATEEQKQ